jgi:transcriptional regulator GlxA family with amidase domain
VALLEEWLWFLAIDPGTAATAAKAVGPSVITAIRDRSNLDPDVVRHGDEADEFEDVPRTVYPAVACNNSNYRIPLRGNGFLILGAAGLLDGYRATRHWLVRDPLPLFGADPVNERVVIDRNRITGGGVTAGIDFGLTLLAHLVGDPYAMTTQLVLVMEYAPEPPFQAGPPRAGPSGRRCPGQRPIRPVCRGRAYGERAVFGGFQKVTASLRKIGCSLCEARGCTA